MCYNFCYHGKKCNKVEVKYFMSNEIAKKFKAQLNEALSSILEALNQNQDTLDDMCFKVISVPNIIIILAVSNVPIRVIIHSMYFLKLLYWVTICSYLVAAIFHIWSLYSANSWFERSIKKITEYSNYIQSVIDTPTELTVERQKEMNDQLSSTHHLNPFTLVLKKIVKYAHIINILSFSIVLIILINNLI